MAPVLDRLRAFLKWRAWSQTKLAEECGCHQTYVSKLLDGTRRANLAFAHAVERITSSPRDDGHVWPEPILIQEWLGATKVLPRVPSAHVESVRTAPRDLPKRRKRVAA